MKFQLLFIAVLFSSSVISQSVIIEGSIKDMKNNRSLEDVEVNVYDMTSDGFSATALSGKDGRYFIAVPEHGNYALTFSRNAYYPVKKFFDTEEETMPHDVKMTRLPGYEFEGTIRELLSYGNTTLGKELKNVKIEIYNHNLDKEVVIIEDDPDHTFSAIFERNNHYTIMLRKKGYFAKRIEAYLDVNGCIICFEGLGTFVNPEIESALTDQNERGSIVTDISMKKIIQDESIVLDNIYYDYNKWFIRKDARPALEKLVSILKRNPIIIELGSHTDSRGADDYNMTLSEKRARAAVDYIVSRGIKPSRITSKGYGESQLVNNCSNGTKCTEIEHQKNRRTEFKVTAFIEQSSFDNKSLAEIIREEKKQGRRSQESLIIMENN